MTRKERYQSILHHFATHQPNPSTELIYGNPFELLVAVVLSAQCTDARINQVTPDLFACFPTPKTLAQASLEEIRHLIRTVSYPNSKAKHLQQLAYILTTVHKGQIPQDAATLQTLPGVGRKTAHVVMATLYGEAKLGVDTHVFRLAQRIGLVSQKAKTPFAVEKEMMRYLPKEYVSKVNHWLVLHGRYICKAREPLCQQCPLTRYCAYYGKKSENILR